MSEVTYHLEKPAADVVAYLSQGPPLYELPLGDVRKAVDCAQAGVPMPDVDETWITVPADVGDSAMPSPAGSPSRVTATDSTGRFDVTSRLRQKPGLVPSIPDALKSAFRCEAGDEFSARRASYLSVLDRYGAPRELLVEMHRKGDHDAGTPR